jgi:hypothetical protein
MNQTKYKIVINTIGVTLEEMEEILEHVKNSFKKGYVTGAGQNKVDKRSYDFKTEEM